MYLLRSRRQTYVLLTLVIFDAQRKDDILVSDHSLSEASFADRFDHVEEIVRR